MLVAYAESTDGLHWTKPELGIRTFGGSKKNSLVNPMGMSCLPDPHETDPQHKYKAASSHWQKMMALLAHSADGLRWTAYNNGEPVTHRAADTINQILWDPEANVYRLYTRTDYQSRLKAKIEVRGTRDMVNPDVKADPTAWKTVREWVLDREPEDYKRRQIYSLNGWIHETIHFGLVWTLDFPDAESEGPPDLNRRHERDVMNAYLVTTRGDRPWNLDWIYAAKPLIPRGPDGSFDKDWVQPAINVVTFDDKHWIYYAGNRERHGVVVPDGRRRGAIGLATLPLDRFVCLEAKDQPGVVETRPFKLEGNRLEVNVDAHEGDILVEVLDQAGKPVKGYTRTEAKTHGRVDELRLPVTWNGSEKLDALVGSIVRLKFHLRHAKLYAFRIAP